MKRKRSATVGWALAAVAIFPLAACSTPLPEPESEGAKLYVTRCVGCHRLYAPNLLTSEMWQMKVDAMQGEMTRRGVAPLNAQERTVLLDYLRRNSG